MELFYERNFYGVLGLLIAACIAMYRFFTKTQVQQLENSNLKLKIELTENFNKKILDSENRLKRIIKEELKEVREDVKNDFKKDKNHLIKNIKHTNDLMQKSLEIEHDKIMHTGEKILNNIKKAND
jgi:methanogenic corrinoid protein MtbC1